MKDIEIKEVGREEDLSVCDGAIVTYHILAGTRQIGDVLVMELADSDWVHCDSIEVYEGFRNRGYGTSVLEALVEIYGAYTITPDNDDAKRLYERIGSENLSWPDAYYTDQGYGVYEIC